MTEQANVCLIDGCTAVVKSRGMCSTHYQRAYRDRKNGRPVRWDDVTLARPRGTRSSTVDYDALERVADLLARHAAAHARITQALLVLEHPGTGFGARATDLLRDALDELDELDTTRKD